MKRIYNKNIYMQRETSYFKARRTQNMSRIFQESIIMMVTNHEQASNYNIVEPSSLHKKTKQLGKRQYRKQDDQY